MEGTVAEVATEKKYTKEQLEILNGGVIEALAELEPVCKSLSFIQQYFNLDRTELDEKDRLKLCIEYQSLNAVLQLVGNAVWKAEKLLEDL